MLVIKFITKLSKCKFILAAPFYTLFDDPKSSKSYNNKKSAVPKNWRSRSRGVAKISFGIPMLHGSRFFFCDSHPAWECDFQTLRHLPSEKLKNHEDAPLEPPCRRHVAKDAIRKSLQNWRIKVATLLFVNFWDSSKSHSHAQKVLKFPTNLNNSRK